MSTKYGIWSDVEAGIYFYEEALVEGGSPAYIEVGAGRFKVDIEFDSKHQGAVVEVPAETMDKLALAWCKHRGLS